MGIDIDRYYRRWYSEDAEIYDTRFEGRTGRLFADLENHMIRDLIQPSSATRILDVGTGTGRASLALADGTGSRVVGLDLTTAMLEQARHKRDSAGLTFPDFVCSNGRSLPFPDHTFDAVTSIRMLHLMPATELRFFVDEMVRVLSPGGQLLIEFNSPFAGGVWVLAREIIRKLKGSKQRYYLWPWQVKSLFHAVERVEIFGFWFPGIGRLAAHSKHLEGALELARLNQPFSWFGNKVLIRAQKPASRS